MKKLNNYFLAASIVFLVAGNAFAQLSPPVLPPSPSPVPPPIVPPIAPPADTTAPAISAIVAASVSSVAETVIWVTNELAVSTFQYGTTMSYGSSATLSANAAIGGTAALTGLEPGTTYYYCITATDVSGNASAACGQSFTTAAAPVVPTVISALTVSSFATSTAAITWLTDKPANTQVEYGLSTSYGSASTLDANLTLAHSALLTGLVPNTLYHYRARSVDSSGSITMSEDAEFTTEQVQVIVLADTTPPVISGAAEASVAAREATIIWSTNELATSTLEYGTTPSYGTRTTFGAGALIVHSGTILNLAPGTTYYYCIHATDLFGNTAHSCGHTFATAAAPSSENLLDTNPPEISLITVASTATSTVTLTWITDEVANGEVQYGLTPSYGSFAGTDLDLSLAHSAAIAGLAANTIYHYRVRSSDQVGNVSYSNDETFTTNALAQVSGGSTVMTPQTNAVIIFSGIETQSVGTSTVTIAWHTDLPSDSQVEYSVSSGLGEASTLGTALTTSHSVTLTGLAQDTNYIFRVVSRPAGVPAVTISGNHEFNTLAQPTLTSIPANVSNVAAVAVGTSTAVISWTTDKNANARVFYGITTEYPQQSDLNFTMQASHSFTLTNLTPQVFYHYRVRSIDETGNITYSDDHAFTTAAIILGNATTTVSTPVSVPASAVIEVSRHDHTSATLAWNVSSTDVAEEYDIRYSTELITENNFANATRDQATLVTYDDLAPEGARRNYVVVGLDPDTTYYFAVKSKYPAGEWSAISNVPSITTATASNQSAGGGARAASGASGSSAGIVSSGPVIGVGAQVNSGGDASAVSGPIAPPTFITAVGDDKQIVLGWNDPDETSFVRTVIVKKEGAYPASPSDGEVIYEGNSETFTDTGVSSGTTYYYAFYSYDRARNYSAPIRVSLAPVMGKTEVVINETPTITRGVEYHFTQVLAQGDTVPEVAHLQGMLVRYNFYPEKLVTSYFGPLTENALKRFQAAHGVPQTGVVDSKTQILLNAASLSDATVNVPKELAVFETDLRLGQTGENIAELQQFLAYEGSYPEKQITGYFGPLTRNAVVAFQRKYDIIPPAGYVGPITRHTIETISGF